MWTPEPASSVLFSYFLGAIPTGYWLGRLRDIDIRQHGSGNVGATNVMRVLGNGPGLLTLAIDIAKGAAAVYIAKQLYPGQTLPALACGVAAIVGHTFSVFVRFEGGKGVATTAGAFGALLPVPMSAAVIIFVLLLAMFRIVSLSSIAAALTLTITSFLTTPDRRLAWSAALMSTFVIWKHRANIERLFGGREPRLGEKPMGHA